MPRANACGMREGRFGDMHDMQGILRHCHNGRRQALGPACARRFGLSMDQSALAATLLLSGLNEESLARLEAASQAS